MLSATTALAAFASTLIAAPAPVEAVRPPVEVRLTSGDDSCTLTVVRRHDGDRVRVTRRGRVVAEASRLRVIDSVVRPTPVGRQEHATYDVTAGGGQVTFSRGAVALSGTEIFMKGGGLLRLARPASSRLR